MKQYTNPISGAKNIKDLNVSLASLYKADKHQLIIHLSDKTFDINVILNSSYLGDCEDVDCKLSSFGANYYSRTVKGINSAKYKSIGSLQASLVKNLKRNWDFKGTISYSLTDKVLTR